MRISMQSIRGITMALEMWWVTWIPRSTLITRGRVMGKHGLRDHKENSESFPAFCNFQRLVIGGIFFELRGCHEFSWVSIDLKCTSSQNNPVAVSNRFTGCFVDMASPRPLPSTLKGMLARHLAGRLPSFACCIHCFSQDPPCAILTIYKYIYCSRW